MESNKTELGNGIILKRERIIIRRKGLRTLYGWKTKLFFDFKLLKNEGAKNKI